MERKLLGLDMIEVKFDAEGSGTFEGYASVFGGVDSYGDTILPGAYKKTLKRKAGDRPIRMRWNHWGPVIGKWLEMAEDEKGLRVKGELTPGHSVAQDVYASLKHGAIDGMSIGYRPVQSRELGDGKRELKEIELVEVSVVEEPADLAARVGDIKSVVDGLASLKDIEAWLREAMRFDRDDAAALVHRFKALARGEREDEPKTSNETALAILALRTHALTMKGK